MPSPITTHRATDISPYCQPVRRLIPGTMRRAPGGINWGSAGLISEEWGRASVTSGRLNFHPDDEDPVEESERLSRMSSRSDVNDSVAEAELLSLLNLNGRERI